MSPSLRWQLRADCTINFTVKSMRPSGCCACLSVCHFCVYAYMAYVYARAWQNIKHLSSKIRWRHGLIEIVQTADESRLIFWHVISVYIFHSEGSFYFSNITKKPWTSEKASFEIKTASSKKWSNGIKTFGPMTRAGMNFDRLVCWRPFGINQVIGWKCAYHVMTSR